MLNDIDILQQKLIFYTLWKKVDVKLAFLYSCIKKSILCRYYRPGHPNRDFHSTYAFIILFKNPQFLPHDYKTRPKSSTHEYLILIDFRNHGVKNVDLLIKAYVL